MKKYIHNPDDLNQLMLDTSFLLENISSYPEVEAFIQDTNN